jgi:protein gp37
MAESNIEWTSKVWNPTTGCNKVSQGCKNCYAEKMHKRLMGMHPDKYKHSFLDGAFEHDPALEIPFKWKNGSLVFVNSMSDLFHENISVEFIAKVYAVMFLKTAAILFRYSQKGQKED